MSRIGKRIVTLEKGVSVEKSGNTITVKGPKGTLSFEISECLDLHRDGDNVSLKIVDESVKKSNALHGLYAKLLFNAIYGVSNGFSKKLLLVGVGYKAQLKGKQLSMSLGFSHSVDYDPPNGIYILVPEQTIIEVHGIDKQIVGQVAAEIREFRKPEPYKGKGVMYSNEKVRRKAGKTSKK